MCFALAFHVSPRKGTETHISPTAREGQVGREIPEERRLEILERVRTNALVRAADLAGRFGVSTETIRRDFLSLERDGLLRRVHGGATRPAPRGFEPSYEQRVTRHLDRKRAMGRLAASLVESGDTLILDVGTSVAEVARAILPSYVGRVLTNSLLVPVELAGREGVEVISAGGRVRPGDLACSGVQANAFFSDHFADKAFLGSGGVSVDAGLTDFYLEEIVARRIIIDHATERYVMADSSKLGQVALGRVCELDRITAVITDDQLEPELARGFERAGVSLLVAPATAADRRVGGAMG